MVIYRIEGETLTAIGNKLREKLGVYTIFTPPQMPKAIDSVYDKGHSEGHTEGYDKGYGEGHTEGYDKGYGEGHTEGYDKGYGEGYNKGYEAGKNPGSSNPPLVVIDSPLPIEIETEAEMQSILDKATLQDVGGIYKYTGTSTARYEKGQLYIIDKEN
jgi:flagellar biosynthesis/type III secretory pathway protein FliH